MSNQKQNGKHTGKGYYIALVLCAAAIGISGYLYYQNTNTPQDTDPGTTGPGVEAVATQPGQTTPSAPNQTQVPTTPSQPMKTGMPVSGSTVSAYAMDALHYNQTTRDWRTHDGIDIAADAGTPVLAAADGTVYTVYEDDALGMCVVLRHDDGYTTCYANLDMQVSVSPGDQVTLGQTIGTVGQTALLENAIGPHLHFSVAKDGESINPEEFLSM